MYPKNTPDVEYPGDKKHNGTRKDGRNLVGEWIDRVKDKVRDETREKQGTSFHLIYNVMSNSVQERKKKRFHAMPLLTNLFFHFLCVCLTLAVYLCSFDDALFIDFPESVLMLLRPLKLALQLCS